MLREQAMQGVRQMVSQRIEQLKMSLPQQPLAGTCDVRISLQAQAAHVACADEQDQARVWPYLIGPLHADEAGASSSAPDACLRLSGPALAWVPCQPPP